MQDYSSRSKHFRALATMVGTTFGQWAIFMLVEEVITHSTEGDGILSKEKIKYKISDLILLIFKSYYSKLKPIGPPAAADAPGAPAPPRARTVQAPPTLGDIVPPPAPFAPASIAFGELCAPALVGTTEPPLHR